jgi:hypothetical protein
MHTLSPPWRRVLVGSWVMIAVLSAVTLVLYVDNRRTRACITNYMVADAESTKARTTLADTERNAFKITLVLLTDPASSREKRAESIRQYIELLNKDDAVRKANPPRLVPTECS